MKLDGSCRCGAVKFSLNSPTPVPFMYCYCSICRKSAGGGGCAVNLGGDADTLRILQGKEAVAMWRAPTEDPDRPGQTCLGPSHRHFCGKCGSALWAEDPAWPDLVHPFASAIDTPLPVPPERVHIMLDFKAPWVTVPSGPGEVHFARYPDLSLEDWHRRHGLLDR
ncbi:GFA family protein [Skermanella pratensis]|uniref:GFA family protein n=1 Tax=Skermanella pratensis TaxID=2233999 RepID=UPI00130100B6|nr:GFA family protein [Skermanella pratensis]